MVEIYLKVDNSHAFVHFLSVPLSDIQRLSICPLKWLRFVVFTICGSHGHLHETAGVNAQPVDYNILDLVESSMYYYIPEQHCTFIDQNALNERVTSSVLTQGRRSFRQHIMERDGNYCVFTHEGDYVCEAVHIIPRSKGDEYIAKVIQLRSHLYNHALVPAISGVNDIQNGFFLNIILHTKFVHGEIAFIKTPNFALNSDDIPRVVPVARQDPTLPTPLNPIIMQQLVPQVSKFKYPDCLDTKLVGDLLPPSILLDYMYGVAAYNRWRVKAIVHPMVDQYFSDNYKSIPVPPQSEPSGSVTSAMHKHHNSPRHQGLEEAMDEMNLFLMHINGITPQALAEKQQAEVEKRQFMAQEESQVKVEGWLQKVPDGEQPEGGAAEENTHCNLTWSIPCIHF